jgi:glycosyltransferase involved in cell wall biosynthesis
MRALGIAETADHVCGRYRLRAFAPALADLGWSLTIEGIERTVLGRIRQIDRAREFDAVLLQRKLLPAWQLHLLRRRARRLIFDFDDAVLFRDSNDRRGPHSPRRLARFRRTMRLADLVIAGNSFLAGCAEEHGADPGRIRVIPTCVEMARYPNEARPPNRDRLDLTWIGSSSTLAGVESQRPTWERIGREIPGTRLRLISDRFPTFDHLDVVPVPWSESTEAAELAEGDVGVSWVPDGLWSRGKCGLKILQYGAAGLPTIANSVGVHGQMIQPGENGFLPETPDEWVESVRVLRYSPETRERMGTSARRFVERHYSVDAWAPAFLAAVAGHGSLPSPPSARTLAVAGRSLTGTAFEAK